MRKRPITASQDPRERYILGYMPSQNPLGRGTYWAICLSPTLGRYILGYMPSLHPPGYTMPVSPLPPYLSRVWYSAGRQGPGLCSEINYGKRRPFCGSFLFLMEEERKGCAELFRSPR